jgi:5-methylcytosine-specific restriction endonuclease McrA
MPEMPKAKPPLTPPKKRSKTADRGYGGAHQRLRKLVLEANPICQVCGNAFSEHMHHVDHNTFNTDPANLQAVCVRCHKRLHSA